MKTLFLILTALCVTQFAIAQKDFHGEVIYKIQVSGEEKTDVELKILFGDRKLKLLFKEKEKYNREMFLVFLDSGITYSVNFEEKMFNRKVLSVSKSFIAPAKKSILGYSATLFQPDKNALGNLGRFMGASNCIFYLADSLTYFVPEKYQGNAELVMTQKNRIVLGSEVHTVDPMLNEEDFSSSPRDELLITEAISIKAMPIDESEFIIPVDFVDKKTISFQPPVIVDTATAMIDSAVVNAKRVKKKTPAKKAPSKTPAKPKAIGRKDTN